MRKGIEWKWVWKWNGQKRERKKRRKRELEALEGGLVTPLSLPLRVKSLRTDNVRFEKLRANFEGAKSGLISWTAVQARGTRQGGYGAGRRESLRVRGSYFRHNEDPQPLAGAATSQLSLMRCRGRLGGHYRRVSAWELCCNCCIRCSSLYKPSNDQ